MNDQIKNILYIKSFIFTVLVLLLISGVFYWFAYRPAKIRHDCSWRWSGNHWYEADNYEYDFCIHEKGLRQ